MRTRQTERRRRSAAVRLLSLSDSDSDQAPGEGDAQAQRDTDALLGSADDPLRQGTVPGVPGMKLGCVLFILVERGGTSRASFLRIPSCSSQMSWCPVLYCFCCPLACLPLWSEFN